MKRRNLLQVLSATGLAGLVPQFLKAEDACITTSDILGPFYSEGAPTTEDLVPEGAQGTLLFLTGTVFYNDGETPMTNTVLDAWQADHDGDYDNVGFDFRGKFATNETASYSMKTILPGKYLNGANFRPRHIHFKVWNDTQELLSTQLYFEGDTDIPADPWASSVDAQCRTIPLATDAEGNLHGVFDVTLNVEPPVVGVNLQNIERGSLLSISPQPVVDVATVNFYSPKGEEIGFNLYNLAGKLVKTIKTQFYNKGQHKIQFNKQSDLGINLSCGMYILQLKSANNVLDAKRLMVQ